MTDLTESTPAQSGAATVTVDPGGSNGATGAETSGSKRRGGGLTALLLPELQSMAGTLGIPGTGRMRKSQLIAAIQAARGEGASRPSTNGSSAPAATNGTESAAAASNSGAAPETVAPSGDSDSAQQNGASQNGASHNGGQRSDNQRSDNQRSDNSQRNGNRQQNNNRQQNSSQQNGSQSGDGGQGDSQQNGNNSQGGDGWRDDDRNGRSRRGRYRERGRNRNNRNDRFGQPGSGGSAGESEPVVTEDDVLIPVGGICDIMDNYAFIRTGGYLSSPDDVYISLSQVRRYNLRKGDACTGVVRQPKDGERKEKFNALVRMDTVNGVEPDQARNRPDFNKLTPLYPQERLRLETEPHILTTRIIDLVAPIGKGQRGLIVSPPKAGKTMILQDIANAITTNNPEVHLMVVLVDERPEEVTDMQRSVKGEVIASTFDRPPSDHTTVAELSIERAKRLVELGHDVVVLLDNLTRLGRAYNLAAPASGRILSGGVDSTALYPPKRFLGAARNIENGGSLTILTTALVETGSTMDTVIFEEFKGTGNMELKLDRKLAERRIFPAVDVDQSGTRKEEILMGKEELDVVWKLRRVLHALDSQQAIELLLSKMKATRSNYEFLSQVQKTSPGE